MENYLGKYSVLEHWNMSKLLHKILYSLSQKKKGYPDSKEHKPVMSAEKKLKKQRREFSFFLKKKKC